MTLTTCLTMTMAQGNLKKEFQEAARQRMNAGGDSSDEWVSGAEQSATSYSLAAKLPLF